MTQYVYPTLIEKGTYNIYMYKKDLCVTLSILYVLYVSIHDIVLANTISYRQ